MNENINITPVRLRPETLQAIGTTAFFRNRLLNDVVLAELKAMGKRHYKLLFHACSIGAEVYSFIIQYLLGNHEAHFAIDVDATDLEQDFVDRACSGQYPIGILAGMTAQERTFFESSGDTASVIRDLRQSVNYMNASSYLDFKTRKIYDMVFLLNTLIYVPSDQQSRTLDKVAEYNSHFLVSSAFHMNSIKHDLLRNHYEPVLTRQVAIHNGWTDRRVTENSNGLAPGTYANWRLPDFSKICDFEYKYCAIFRKQSHSF